MYLYSVFVRFELWMCSSSRRYMIVLGGEFVLLLWECVTKVFFLLYMFYFVFVCVDAYRVKSYPILRFESISKYWLSYTHARTYRNPFNHSVKMCVFYPVNFHYAKIHNSFVLIVSHKWIHAPSITIHLITSLLIPPSILILNHYRFLNSIIHFSFFHEFFSLEIYVSKSRWTFFFHF